MPRSSSRWTLNKAIAAALLGGFVLLLNEIRFEHREVLGGTRIAWTPIVFCIAALLIGSCALSFWEKWGRKALLTIYAISFVVGLAGVWFHSDGHLGRVFQVLSVWTLKPGEAGHFPQDAPPVLAPLAFCGLGLLGVIACSYWFAAESSTIAPELVASQPAR